MVEVQFTKDADVIEKLQSAEIVADTTDPLIEPDWVMSTKLDLPEMERMEPDAREKKEAVPVKERLEAVREEMKMEPELVTTRGDDKEDEVEADVTVSVLNAITPGVLLVRSVPDETLNLRCSRENVCEEGREDVTSKVLPVTRTRE